MPTLSPVDAAVSSSGAVGRYFAVVSVIPAALLVLYVALLVWAGALSGPLDPSGVGSAVDAFGIGDLAWFVAAALLVAIAMHPLQFALTQLLEGYWGTSRLALRLSTLSATRHHRRMVWLREQRKSAYREWVVLGSKLWNPTTWGAEEPEISTEGLRDREKAARRALARPSGIDTLPSYHAQQAFERELSSYPGELHRVMPTRLGNVLRRSEDQAGRQYGLDTLVIAPHLSLVAKPEHYAYVRDRQKAMDLAISMCLAAALATTISAIVLSDDGAWCMLALLPFGISYASYLGAVAAARSYNVAIETVTDLSRFALYDAMHLPRPTSGAEETDTAEMLMGLLRGNPRPTMPLLPRDSPPACGDGGDEAVQRS